MPVCERFAARKINDSESPSAETTYMVWDDGTNTITDEITAYAALVAHPMPTTYTFPSGRVADLVNVAINDIDEKNWDFVLSYDVFQPKEENDVEYEFEAGSQQVTLTHASATTPFTGGGRIAPDFGGGININSNGEIQGISVDRPRFNFTLTKYWPTAVITPAYQIAVSQLVGKVNNATFGGYAAGTIRFLGARGRIAGNKWPIAYRFEFSPNETGISVGDVTGISRTGWQYLDIYKRTTSDATAKKKVELPHSVYVHTVYEPADFSILGL
jgi:hypothetical protein